MKNEPASDNAKRIYYRARWGAITGGVVNCGSGKALWDGIALWVDVQPGLVKAVCEAR